MSEIFPPAGRVNRTIWAAVHWQPKCWAKRWRIWRQRINKIHASSDKKASWIHLRLTTNSHTRLLGFYSSGNTVGICRRGGLTVKRDVNPVSMEILLNKLKAGRALKHWAESGATHSLPSCIMHTNMLFFVFSAVNNRAQLPQLWLRHQMERRLGKSWQSVWFKMHHFPLTLTRWAQWAEADRGYLSRLESTFGMCQFRFGSRESR